MKTQQDKIRSAFAGQMKPDKVSTIRKTMYYEGWNDGLKKATDIFNLLSANYQENLTVSSDSNGGEKIEQGKNLTMNYDDLTKEEKLACISLFPVSAKNDSDWIIRREAETYFRIRNQLSGSETAGTQPIILASAFCSSPLPLAGR